MYCNEMVVELIVVINVLWRSSVEHFMGIELGVKRQDSGKLLWKVSKINPSFHDLETHAGKLGKMVIALHPSIF
jgi:hypothetical protein